MTVIAYVMVLACIGLETLEQIAFKVSSEPGRSNRFFTGLGILAYVLHMTVWFWVLAILPLGVALPLMGATYITVAFAGRFLFAERLNARRWGGIVLIALGLCLVWKIAQ